MATYSELGESWATSSRWVEDETGHQDKRVGGYMEV